MSGIRYELDAAGVGARNVIELTTLAAHRSRVAAAIEKLKKHRAMLDRKLRAGCVPNAFREVS